MVIRENDFAYFDAFSDNGTLLLSSTSPLKLIRHGYSSGQLTLSEALALANEFGVATF
jgi:hypothetical protein